MDAEQNQPSGSKTIGGSQASAEEWLFPGCDSKKSGVYQHERYRLRKIDIGFSVLGIILSSIYLGVSWYVPATQLVALIPLVLSIVWDIADLASPRSVFKQGLPPGLLVFVDGLLFLSFIALLIVNGLSHQAYRSDEILIAAYASIPWMASSAIHGFIAFKTIWSWARWVDPNSSRGKVATCPDCKRRWKNVPEDPSAGEAAERGEHYSLLDEEGGDHEDVEATASA